MNGATPFTCDDLGRIDSAKRHATGADATATRTMVHKEATTFTQKFHDPDRIDAAKRHSTGADATATRTIETDAHRDENGQGQGVW